MPKRRALLPAQTHRGKSHKEALRCLKERLSETVFRHLQREARTRTTTGREDTQGHSPDPPAPSLQPTNQDLLDTQRGAVVLTGP
jgi:hypothetical protein